MKTLKIIFITSGVSILLIAGILFYIAVLPWLLIGAGMLFAPKDPRPEITYGEFPFELVYEIDGQVITVQDTYVCEFQGYSVNEGSMRKMREWSGHMKSTGEEYVILVQDGNFYLVCSVGSPKYYMNDPYYDSYNVGGLHEPNIFYIIEPNDVGGSTSGGSQEEIERLMEQYKIKLVSWQFSEPIENTFK